MRGELDDFEKEFIKKMRGVAYKGEMSAKQLALTWKICRDHLEVEYEGFNDTDCHRPARGSDHGARPKREISEHEFDLYF